MPPRRRTPPLPYRREFTQQAEKEPMARRAFEDETRGRVSASRRDLRPSGARALLRLSVDAPAAHSLGLPSLRLICLAGGQEGWNFSR